MADDAPGELADRYEREADDLDRRSRELSQETSDVREDWRRKCNDPQVPGAPPPQDEEGEQAEREPTPPD